MTIEELRNNLLRRIENNENDFTEEELIIIENDESVYIPLFIKIANDSYFENYDIFYQPQ